jgi:hypothetical protein
LAGSAGGDQASGNDLNKIRWAGLALGAAIVAAGFVSYDEEDFIAAQAATDRETVDCLTQQLTHDEKVSIARLSAEHDNENMRRVYGDIFARCVIRNDQWDRRSQLVTSARQSLSLDKEFRAMLYASTMGPSRRQ